MASLLKYLTTFNLALLFACASDSDPRISVLKKYDNSLDKRQIIFVVRDDFCPTCIKKISRFLQINKGDQRVFSIFYFNHSSTDLNWYFDSDKANQVVIRPYKESDPLLDSSKVIFMNAGKIERIKRINLENYEAVIQEMESGLGILPK